MKKYLVFFIAAFISAAAYSQNVPGNQQSEPPKHAESKLNLGFGIGLDYGGIGGRLAFSPDKHIDIFGGAGYNFLGAGFNAGLAYKFLPESFICPYISAMYGYNGVIKVTNAAEYNQTYYGPSFSIGGQFWSHRMPGFFNLELVIPVRSSEMHDDYNKLKNLGASMSALLPVAFSVGFHFLF
ncbi:MAG TPA: hypothetical protein VMT63_11075 [Bacteroidales bacterium]|nr:hypothetical protein [Bacteroidales bacterium]